MRLFASRSIFRRRYLSDARVQGYLKVFEAVGMAGCGPWGRNLLTDKLRVMVGMTTANDGLGRFRFSDCIFGNLPLAFCSRGVESDC